MGGLAFRIHAPGGVARIEWEHGAVWLDANEVLGGFEDRHATGTRREAAEEWLREELAEGPVKATKVEDDAKAAGIKGHTLQDAAKSLRVKRDKLGFHDGWEWSLPQHAAHEDAGAHTRVNGPFEKVPENEEDNGNSSAEDTTIQNNGMFEGTPEDPAHNGAPPDEDAEDATIQTTDAFGQTGMFGEATAVTTGDSAEFICSLCGNREQNFAAARYHHLKLCPLLGKKRGA
jgi:hypothetical protein